MKTCTVPTKLNPADLLTRGLSISTLAEEKQWWNGPSFLKQPPSEWPETKIEMKVGFNSEVRKSYQAREQAGEKAFFSSVGEDRLQPQRCSSWSRLTRVAARVDRFLENCRLPAAFRRENEVASSGMRFVRQAQQEVLKEEIRAVKTKKELPNGSRLQPLRPVLSEGGILR